MIRRLLLLAPIVAVAACLVLLPACGKKAPPVAPGGDPNVPAPGAPSGVASDYVVFAHLNGKDVVGGELFAEVKKAFGGPDGAKAWADLEKEGQASFGVKPTDVVSLSAFVTEVPDQDRDAPKAVAVLVTEPPIDKAAVLTAFRIPGTADARGFHKSGPDYQVHFPHGNAVAVIHPALADQYLGGFATDRAGWPTNADLMKAAEGHTVYAQVDVDKLRPAMKLGRDMDQFAPLLAAKTAVLTLDLKGKTFDLNLRATFPDAAAAGKAKELVTQFLPLAQMLVDGAATGKGAAELGGALPAVKAAQKAVKEAKVEAAGADLIVSVRYTADFNVGAVVAEAMKKVKGASERMVSSNNLKQIGLALHNIHDSQGAMPVHGVGKNGAMLKAGDKPLLSWRVAILPYLEQDTLYKQFKLDEPWDSETNKKLIDKMPKVFQVPSGKAAKAGHTHYQMAVGATAMQPKGWRLVDISDGVSNTLAVAEAAQAVIWTKPDDIMLPGKDAPKDLKKKFGGLYPGGFNVLTWDGSVTFVSETVPEATLRALLTPRGGEVVGPLR